MTFALTILQQASAYTFIWGPPREFKDGQASAPLQCWATTQLHPQQQAELQAAIDSAAQVAHQLRRANLSSPQTEDATSQSLKRLGSVLFSQLLPHALQERLRQLPPMTPILLYTNDPNLPWELLHDDQEFLALRHGVARHLLLAEHSLVAAPAPKRNRLSCLLIGNPTGDLPEADQEIENLLDLLDTTSQRPRVEFLCRQQATKVRVLTAFASGEYDLIHFACHATPMALCLADGWLTSEEIRSALRGAPLIFLNACSSARATEPETTLPFAGQQVRSLAHSFLLGSAQAFIGTLWPMADGSSRRLALAFYRNFFSGHALGEALRLARLQTVEQNSGDIAWAAPVLYGDPAHCLPASDLLRRPGSVLFLHLPPEPAHSQFDSLEEDTQRLARDLSSLMRPIVTHGGAIVSVSPQQICALFGLPHLFEDDAARAIRAALEVRQLTQAWETGPPAFTIASGEIVTTSLSVAAPLQESPGAEVPLYLGNALAEAKELALHSRPGQILATERTSRLASTLFRFVAVVEAPIAGYEVSALTSEFDMPPPSTEHQRRRNTLLGRAAELAALSDYWQGARLGRGQVVGIVGEAGIGKTRLLQEFRQTLAPEQCLWLSASCPSSGRESPYTLINQLLRQIFGIASGEDAASAEIKIERGLQQLPGAESHNDPQLIQILHETLGLSSAEFPLEERKARRGRLVHLLRNLMANAARQTPLLIAVDDIHWIDDASLEILDQVTDGISRLPVQIILLYRPEWQHSWFKKAYYRHLPLDHLDEAACGELLCSLLQTNKLPSGLSPLLTKTGGNPFFIEEMVKSLIETGVLARQPLANGQITDYASGPANDSPNDQDNQRWELGVPLSDSHLPDTVQRVLLVRFERLSPATRQVLEGGAVIGPIFTLALLRALLGVQEQTLEQSLAELEDRNFIYARWDSDDYRFRHALIQDTAYQSLFATQRQMLHRRIADTLAVAADKAEIAVETVAHHYFHSLLLSLPEEAPKLDETASQEQLLNASVYLIQSGKRAQERFAAREALNYYRRAMMVERLHEEEAATAIEIYEGMGDAHTSLGDFSAASKELRQAYAALHTQPLTKVLRRRAADLARRIGRLAMWNGQHDLALTWMQEGLRQLSPSEEADDLAIAALLSIHTGSVHYNRGNLEEAFHNCRAGIELVGDDEPAVQAEGYNLLGITYWARGQNDEALHHYRRSRELWLQLNNSYQAARIAENIGVVHFQRAEWESARAYYERSLQYWEQIDNRDSAASSYLNLGNLHLYQGDWMAAHSSFEHALQLWEQSGNQRCIALCHTNLGLLKIEQEEWVQADEYLHTSQSLLLKMEIRDLLTETYYALAEVALGQGQAVLAQEQAEHALRLATELDMPFERAMALRILGRILAYNGQNDPAREKLDESFKLMQSLENRYEIARSLYHLARHDYDAGRREQALNVLEQAIAIFGQVGAQKDLERALRRRDLELSNDAHTAVK